MHISINHYRTTYLLCQTNTIIFTASLNQTNKMKVKFTLVTLLLLINTLGFAQKKKETKEETVKDTQFEDAIKLIVKNDSIEKTFNYQYGTVQLKDGIATLVVPQGFKYLDGKNADKVLEDFWGNPKSDIPSLGMIMPDSLNVAFGASSGYVFNITYETIGFVKDDDAGDINYDDLLKQIKEDLVQENKERVKQGFETADLVGWASKPFYDKEKKVLHWAKEIKFGNDTGVNTLNYDIRILGRKGVMNLTAISTMNNLGMVKKDIDKVLNTVQFNAGNQYKDFDSKVDNVAAWTIGGLVAGKILAKVGFFAVLLKFWKIAALAIFGFFAGIWKKIKRKKNTTEETTEEVTSDNI